MGCHIYLYTRDGKEWKDTPWIRIANDKINYYDRRYDDPQTAFEFIQHLRKERPGSLSYLNTYTAPKRGEFSCKDCTPAASCECCKQDSLDAFGREQRQRQEYEAVQSNLMMGLDIIETFIASDKFGYLGCS